MAELQQRSFDVRVLLETVSNTKLDIVETVTAPCAIMAVLDELQRHVDDWEDDDPIVHAVLSIQPSKARGTGGRG